MSYLATGDVEATVPATSKPVTQRDLNVTLAKIDEFIDGQQKIRMITIAAAVGGLLYTMARFGELATSLRAARAAHGNRRRH